VIFGVLCYNSEDAKGVEMVVGRLIMKGKGHNVHTLPFKFWKADIINGRMHDH